MTLDNKARKEFLYEPNSCEGNSLNTCFLVVQTDFAGWDLNTLLLGSIYRKPKSDYCVTLVIAIRRAVSG